LNPNRSLEENICLLFPDKAWPKRSFRATGTLAFGHDFAVARPRHLEDNRWKKAIKDHMRNQQCGDNNY
jgi:hypothetical protein